MERPQKRSKEDCVTHEYPSTPHPSRRDLHRTARPRRIPQLRPLSRWDRRVLFGLPTTLLLVALSAGLFTGASASAEVPPQPAAATATPSAALPATPSAAPAAVADAQVALRSAERLAKEPRTVAAKQRKRIESLSAELRALMTDRSDAAASRAGERQPVEAARAADDEAQDAKAGRDAAEAAPSAAPAEDQAAPATAGQEDGTTEPAPIPSAAPAEIAPPSLPTDVTPLDDTADATIDDTSDAERPETAAPAPTQGEAADAAATSELKQTTEALTDLIRSAEASAVKIKPAPATPKEVLARQVRAAREAAPKLKKHARALAGHENGEIPSRELCKVGFARGEALRCDATQQLERLNRAYRARFGTNLDIVDSYRSYAAQVATAASRGYLAAVPGYSNHGWAVALDLGGGVQQFGSAQHNWLRKHGPAFGWDNPGWARADGRKPEAWHWEYKAR